MKCVRRAHLRAPGPVGRGWRLAGIAWSPWLGLSSVLCGVGGTDQAAGYSRTELVTDRQDRVGGEGDWLSSPPPLPPPFGACRLSSYLNHIYLFPGCCCVVTLARKRYYNTVQCIRCDK